MRDRLKFLVQHEKNAQMAITSVLIFLLCFICLNLFATDDQAQVQSSQLLPLVLNATEPYLITGNIQRLKPDLEQLVLGSSIERIDILGADSTLLTSIRNLNVDQPASSSLEEFSQAIVLDNALAATVILQEHLAIPAPSIWPNFLISFACALAAAIAQLFFNTLQNTGRIGTERPEEDHSYGSDLFSQADEQEAADQLIQTPLPLHKKPKGHQRLVLMIRLSDMRDCLARTDEVDNYLNRIWRITERMADTYAISCIGVQSGSLIFTASGTNNAIALRHCIMFGWNLCRPEKQKPSFPASLIAPIDFFGENPCHALALASNEDLLNLQFRLDQLPAGEFQICRSLQDHLPKSVDAIKTENNNFRVLSIETRMLDLWKKQTRL